MATDQRVTMSCPHCGFVACEAPEAFRQEYSCPRCGRKAIFRRVEAEGQELLEAVAAGSVRPRPRPETKDSASPATASRLRTARRALRRPAVGIAAGLLLAAAAGYGLGAASAREAAARREAARRQRAERAAAERAAARERAREALVRALRPADTGKRLAALDRLRDELADRREALPALLAEVNDARAETLQALRHEERAAAGAARQAAADLAAEARDLKREAQALRRSAAERYRRAEEVLAREEGLERRAAALQEREADLQAMQKRLDALETRLVARDKALEEREEKAAAREDQITKVLAKLAGERRDAGARVVVPLPRERPSPPVVRSSTVIVRDRRPVWPIFTHPFIIDHDDEDGDVIPVGPWHPRIIHRDDDDDRDVHWLGDRHRRHSGSGISFWVDW